MPRKATPQSSEVQKVIATIQGYCKSNNISILALSHAVKVSQSSLNRFINGERKTVTPTANKCLSHINSQHNWHNWHNDNKDANEPNPANGYSVIIENAAMSLWDGDPRTVELIASIIRGLKPAVEIAIAPTKGHKRGISYDN